MHKAEGVSEMYVNCQGWLALLQSYGVDAVGSSHSGVGRIFSMHNKECTLVCVRLRLQLTFLTQNLVFAL